MKTIRSRIIQGVVMPDGWHYEFNVTPDSKLRLVAVTLPDLVTEVMKYRLENNIPIGDPLKDIEEYVCTTYPRQCHQTPGATVTIQSEHVPAPSDRKALLDRIIGWFEAQLQNVDSNNLVIGFEAQRRAQICEGCPYNRPFDVGCSSCKANIDRLSSTIRYGNRLTSFRDKKLKGCAIMGHENRAAVWLRTEKLGYSESLPGNCWIAHENQRNSG